MAKAVMLQQRSSSRRNHKATSLSSKMWSLYNININTESSWMAWSNESWGPYFGTKHSFVELALANAHPSEHRAPNSKSQSSLAIPLGNSQFHQTWLIILFRRNNGSKSHSLVRSITMPFVAFCGSFERIFSGWWIAFRTASNSGIAPRIFLRRLSSSLTSSSILCSNKTFKP
jgi:hypothetical protein